MNTIVSSLVSNIQEVTEPGSVQVSQKILKSDIVAKSIKFEEAFDFFAE